MNKIVQMFFEICLSRLECMHTVNENQGCLPCENVGASTNKFIWHFCFVTYSHTNSHYEHVTIKIELF